MAHRLNQEELAKQLQDAHALVSVGANYVHYKDPTKSYIVRGLAILEGTEEAAVIYEGQYGEHISFIRSLESWISHVEVNGVQTPRFRRL